MGFEHVDQAIASGNAATDGGYCCCRSCQSEKMTARYLGAHMINVLVLAIFRRILISIFAKRLLLTCDMLNNPTGQQRVRVLDAYGNPDTSPYPFEW